jgi:hypothetical protein
MTRRLCIAFTSFNLLRMWPGITSGSDRITLDPTCGNVWDLFFQIDKVSRVLDIAVGKPWIPEPGSSGT